MENNIVNQNWNCIPKTQFEIVNVIPYRHDGTIPFIHHFQTFADAYDSMCELFDYDNLIEIEIPHNSFCIRYVPEKENISYRYIDICFGLFTYKPEKGLISDGNVYYWKNINKDKNKNRKQEMILNF